MEKTEYSALLDDGFHLVTLDELRELCVTALRFGHSRTRSGLMDRLANLVFKVTDLGIVGELWINGSFLTEKLDPHDVDLSLRIQASVYDHGTPEQVACLDWLTQIYDSEKIDGYLHIEFPVGDPNYALGVSNYEYWKNQWGLSRTGIAKGIAVLQLGRRT